MVARYGNLDETPLVIEITGADTEFLLPLD